MIKGSKVFSALSPVAAILKHIVSLVGSIFALLGLAQKNQKAGKIAEAHSGNFESSFEVSVQIMLFDS